MDRSYDGPKKYGMLQSSASMFLKGRSRRVSHNFGQYMKCLIISTKPKCTVRTCAIGCISSNTCPFYNVITVWFVS